MSSEPGESHSSAQDHGDETDVMEGAEDAEELQSVGSAEGLTFARTRRNFAQEDAHDAVSELSMRPRVERPESPASTDIPDDTPSIQVCPQDRTE
jgi:hypothetical protein